MCNCQAIDVLSTFGNCDYVFRRSIIITYIFFCSCVILLTMLYFCQHIRRFCVYFTGEWFIQEFYDHMAKLDDKLIS